MYIQTEGACMANTIQFFLIIIIIADHVTYTANGIPQIQSCDCTLNVLLHS